MTRYHFALRIYCFFEENFHFKFRLYFERNALRIDPFLKKLVLLEIDASSERIVFIGLHYRRRNYCLLNRLHFERNSFLYK